MLASSAYDSSGGVGSCVCVCLGERGSLRRGLDDTPDFKGTLCLLLRGGADRFPGNLCWQWALSLSR